MNLEWYAKVENALAGCNTPECLRSVLNQHLAEMSLPNWAVAVQVPSSLHAPETYSVNNFDDLWWQVYVENNWVIHDPLPQYALTHDQPRMWTLVGWADTPNHRWEQDDPGAVDFFNEVERFGARSGLLIPYHLGDNTRAGLNLPHPEPIEASVSHLKLARIWVYAVMPQIIDAVRRVYHLVKGEKLPTLTPREREVLFWVGEGLTSKAIAEQLGISCRTVEHYLAEIQIKLGVSNRQQAVAKAVNIGLVSPAPLLDGMTYSISAGRERYHGRKLMLFTVLRGNE